MRDFLGGPVAGNLPANAEDTGSVPGRIGFHMPQGSWAHVWQILKPTHPRACAPQQEKPPQWDVRTPQLESSPSLLQLEKAQVQQQRPSTAKKKKDEEISFMRKTVTKSKKMTQR